MDGQMDSDRNEHIQSGSMQACTHKHRKKDGTDRLRYKHKHITNGRTDVKNDFHANINIQSQTNRWMDGDTTIHT